MTLLKITSEAIGSIDPSLRAACLERARQDVWRDKRLTNLPKRLFEVLLLAIDWRTGCCPPSSLDTLRRIFPVHKGRLWLALKKLVACQQIVVGPAIAPGGGVAFRASFPGVMRAARQKVIPGGIRPALRMPPYDAMDSQVVPLVRPGPTDEAQR